MWRALPAIRAAIEAREDLLVTLVEGDGAHFSAGVDIVELGEIYRDAAATRDFGDAMQNGLKALMDLDRPTIAVIRGVAIGAGLGRRCVDHPLGGARLVLGCGNELFRPRHRVGRIEAEVVQRAGGVGPRRDL